MKTPFAIITFAALLLAATTGFAITPRADDDPNATGLYRTASLKNTTEVTHALQYTEMMRQMGLEGSVVLRIRVDANGRVADYRVSNYSHPVLLARVLETLPTLSFQPALNQGEAASSWITMPFRFDLGN